MYIYCLGLGSKTNIRIIKRRLYYYLYTHHDRDETIGQDRAVRIAQHLVGGNGVEINGGEPLVREQRCGEAAYII